MEKPETPTLSKVCMSQRRYVRKLANEWCWDQLHQLDDSLANPLPIVDGDPKSISSSVDVLESAHPPCHKVGTCIQEDQVHEIMQEGTIEADTRYAPKHAHEVEACACLLSLSSSQCLCLDNPTG